MFRALYRNRFRKTLRSKKINYAFLLTCVALACTVSLTPCYAQQIITDGNTATTLNTNGTVTDVTTTTTKGNNAFNSFSKFNVDTGNTVNLVVPDASDNLINIVNGSQTQINGVLNSIKQGNVGGNIFLANPNGIVIGTQGVVNVGSITAVTPTADFTNNFFNGIGDPNDASVTALIDGTAPINVNSSIINNGKISAITDVKLDSGSITNEGDIYTDAVFNTDIETGDIVNLNTLDYVENIDDLVLENGEITLRSNDVIITEGTNIAGKDVELIADDFNIAQTANIIAGNEVVLSRRTVGDLTISETGNLTPNEISTINANVVIGNDVKTNNNIDKIDVRSDINKNNGNITFSSNRVTLDGCDIQVEGNINLKADKSIYMYRPSLKGVNIIIDPNERLDLQWPNIEASNELIVNGGNVLENGITFSPNYIKTKILTSDFLQNEGPLSLKSVGGITINCLNRVYINKEQLQVTDVYIESLGLVEFDCNNLITGDINIKADYFRGWPEYEGNGDISIHTKTDMQMMGCINTSGNINLTSDQNLSLDMFFYDNNGEYIPKKTLSAENIYLNAGYLGLNLDIVEVENMLEMNANWSLRLSPGYIKTKQLKSNFLTQNAPLDLEYIGNVAIGNFDNIYIDNKPLNVTGLNIKAGEIEILGNNTIQGDVNLSAGKISLKGYDGFISAENITIDPSKVLVLSHFSLEAKKDLVLNAGNIKNNGGFAFLPNKIIAKTLTSDFLNDDGSLLLNSPEINLGNLDNIYIDGLKHNFSNITVNGSRVALNGDITSSSDINVTFSSRLNIDGNISAAGDFTLNKSSDIPEDVFFRPVSMNVNSFNSNFLFNGDSINLVATDDANMANLNNIIVAGQPLTIENIYMKAAYCVLSNVSVQNNINIIGGDVYLNGTVQAGNDITVYHNPRNIGYMDIDKLIAGNNINLTFNKRLGLLSGEIYAQNNLTINAANIYSEGISFFPDSIQAGNLSSNFLKQNGSLNIQSTNNVHFSDLDNIIISGEPLNLYDINLKGNNVSLQGDNTARNNITLIGKRSAGIKDYSNITAGNNISLISDRNSIGFANVLAGNKLIMNNLGKKTSYAFAPNSIVANAFESNYIHLSPDLVVSGYDYIYLGNLTNISINNQDFNLNSLNLNANKSIDLSGNINVAGDVNLSADTINLECRVYVPEVGYSYIPLDLTANNVNINANIGHLNFTGSIKADSINMSTFGDLKLDGTLEATGIQSDASLLINANGNIHASSNIGASIANGIITIDDVINDNAGLININARNIIGTGELIATGGPLDATITNYSANHLQFNDFKLVTTGQIIINGSHITESFDDISVNIAQGSGTGNIDINNNTASNVIVAGNMQGNNIDILSKGNLEIDGSLTAGNDILLTADNFDIAPTANISAGNEVVFNSDTFTISDTGNLTPQAIGNIDSDVVINTNGDVGLYSDIYKENGSLSFNADNIYYKDNVKIQTDEGNIGLNVGGWLSSHPNSFDLPWTESYSLSLYAYSETGNNNGNINIKGEYVYLKGESLLFADNNITVEAYKRLETNYINQVVRGLVIIAGDKLTLNAFVPYAFNPEYVSVKSLDSNFLAHHAPMTVDHMLIGNLDRIYIDGSVLMPIDINLEHTALVGGANASGDINATYYLCVGEWWAPKRFLTVENLGIKRDIEIINVAPDHVNELKAGGDLNFTGQNYPRIFGGKYTATNINLKWDCDFPISFFDDVDRGSVIFNAINDVTINTNDQIYLRNSIITAGNDITINAKDNIKINYDSLSRFPIEKTFNEQPVSLKADNNIYLTSNSILFDKTANVTAGNLLQITTPNNISKTGTPLTASNLNITANNINNYLALNVANSTNINTIGNCLISGTTGALTVNTGGVFFYNDPLASSMNINAGGQVNIDKGFVSGNVNITTTAPGLDGPAEIMLGHLNDLDIDGNLSATATNGNIYYYGGSVGGNAAFSSGEAYDHRVSTAIGRYRPLDIAGNLNVTSAGHMSFMEGSVGGDTTINAAKMAGLFDVDLGGDLTANAMAFGYFAGNCAGDINITAPMGVLLGVGNLLNVSGNVNANSTYGPIIMLDSNVSGGINAETTEVINLGNFNEFVNTNFTYNNTTYNYNNLPVVVTNSDLAIAGNLHLLGEDNICVDLSRGNLYSDYINTSDGSAFINNNGGNVYINYISAPQKVSVTAAGNITINTIDPADIILKSANKGGIINIGEAYFSDNALLSGDYIFGDFFNTSNKPYSFNISGAGGAKASEVELQLISASGIVVNDIKSNKATLNVLTPDTELIIENQDVNYFKINKIDRVDLDDQLLGDNFKNDYIKEIVLQSTIANSYSSISDRLNNFFIKNMQQQNDEDFVIEKKLDSKLAKINTNYDLTDSDLIQLAYELSKIYNNQISKGFTEVEARLAVLKYLRTFNLNLSSVQKQVADRGLNVNLEF